MTIKNISDANRALIKHAKVTSQLIGNDISPDRMSPILELLDNPHCRLKVIHIAGTSGKTSTAYYCSELLRNSGKKVGLTVSPHINSITERVQINGNQIAEKKICQYLEELMVRIKELDFTPGYFEVMIALALWVFAEEKVDYAVVETGLGGTFDSTNIITNPDKLCVITDIGFDHTKILGETIAKIAAQKAGIIHSGNHVFMHSQSEEINSVISERVSKVNAHLQFVKIDSKYQNNENLHNSIQFRNYQLSLSACKYVAFRDKFSLKEVDLNNIVIPGRLEEIRSSDNSVIILDGAHNQQKTQAMVKYLKTKYPNQKFDVLLAFKPGKDYKNNLIELVSIINRAIITKYKSSQDLLFESVNPKEIANYLSEKGVDVETEQDSVVALQKLLSTKSKYKLITGSFYLVGQLHDKVQNQHPTSS